MKIEIPKKVEASLRRDCMIAARDLMGSDFTEGYYQSVSNDFYFIALSAYREGFEEGFVEGRDDMIQNEVRIQRGNL